MLFTFNSYFWIKCCLIVISIGLSIIGFSLMTQYYLATPESKTYERLKNLTESKYVIKYLAHSYILFLWLFAVGDNEKLNERFFKVLLCSTFLFVCSMVYRLLLLFFPALWNPWLLCVCIIIFGLNNIFRAAIRAGILTSKIITDTMSDSSNDKPQILLFAETLEIKNEYYFWFLKKNKSEGQIRLTLNVNQPTILDNEITLDAGPMMIYSDFSSFCFYAYLITTILFGIGFFSGIIKYLLAEREKELQEKRDAKRLAKEEFFIAQRETHEKFLENQRLAFQKFLEEKEKSKFW